MAIIRKDLRRGQGPNGTYDAICENAADFATEEGLPLWADGSIMICLNQDGDGRATVHIKTASGEWAEVTV